MNNYNKTELQLDGLDIEGLYLEDVFSVWEHFDKNANKYFTVFMINNSGITVPGTDANTAMLSKVSHGVTEFTVKDGSVRETLISRPYPVSEMREDFSHEAIQ